MKSRVGMSFFLFAVLAWLLSPGLCMAEATVSLKAVAINGVAISPTNSLQIQPDDVITADIFLFGWNDPPFDGGEGLIHSFQITLAGMASALSSNACGPCNTGYVLPVGWDAPLEHDACPCDVACFTTCPPLIGASCHGPEFNPTEMASIDTARADWLFHGFSDLNAVDVSSPNVRWGSVTWKDGGQTATRCSGGSSDGFSCSAPADCPDGFCDPNYSSYAGTLNLKAGAAICGTYTISFEGGYETWIANHGPPGQGVLYPATEGLTLTTGLTCTETWGSCCNEEDHVCQEQVCQNDCMEPNQRFGGTGSTCAMLDPPCDPPTGACCVGNSCDATICTEGVPESECFGRWGGSYSTCATMHPPCHTGCPPLVISPANCAVDARRPFPPNQPGSREGVRSWTWTFPNAPGSGENAPNDFAVRQVPSTTPPVPPTISSVSMEPGNAVTLHFSAPIQPDKWTCVKHFVSGIEKCLGYLPGDVDANRTVSVVDIMKIIDNLNGVVHPPLPLHQCDIDRSGFCAPADILTEIDLLNGVTGFQRQNGKQLEPCPSAP